MNIFDSKIQHNPQQRTLKKVHKSGYLRKK